MAGTIFYRSGPGPGYSKYYGAEVRNQRTLDFLYRKIAYARASGGGSSVGTQQGGGIGKGGLYEPGDPTSANDARFLPKPHITSVRISNEGNLGTIKKAEVAFTVYSPGQLAGMAGFFKLGKNLTISYGWSEGFSGGSFSGKIYNFSYSLNADGGFDCVSYGMGKGNAIATGNAASNTDSVEEFTDENGKVFKAGSIFSTLKVAANNIVGPAATTTNFDIALGVGGFAIDRAWTEISEDPENPIPANSPKMYLYASLKRIVEEVNNIISKFTTDQKFVIASYNNTTITPVSASPLTVLCGPAEYGTNSYAGAPDVGNDPGNFLIAIDFLEKISMQLGENNTPTGQSRDVSFGKFFGDIFQEIAKATGKETKLTLAGADNGRNVLIIDSEDTDPSVAPTNLTAVTQNGICRSMTITSKLPSQLQAAAFIGGDFSSIGKGAWEALGAPGGGTAPAATPTSADAKAAMDAGGPTPENVETLSAAKAADYYTKVKSGTIPIPIDFGATIDGFEGFKFGQAVTSNYLPGAYRGGKVGFAITRVEHNISGGDWTTTIQTVCRLATA